jgi:hypothetical protein
MVSYPNEQLFTDEVAKEVGESHRLTKDWLLDDFPQVPVQLQTWKNLTSKKLHKNIVLLQNLQIMFHLLRSV